MTKEQMNQYSLRISQSNRSGLVVIIFEIIEEYIKEADESYKNGDTEGFTHRIRKAREFLGQLSSGLDFHYAISFELMNLYRFADDRLYKSEMRRQLVDLDVVMEMMGKLRTAFEEVAKSDSSGPVMRGREQVYEGLTYGRNGRNNVTVSNLYS